VLVAGCGKNTLDLSTNDENRVETQSDADQGTKHDDSEQLGDAGDHRDASALGGGSLPNDGPSDDEMTRDDEPQDTEPMPTATFEPDGGGPDCRDPEFVCPQKWPYCDYWGHCVECLSSVHCQGGEVCQDPWGVCVPGCYSDRDCSEIGQQCNFATNLCVPCTSSWHCNEVYGPDRSVCYDDFCRPCNGFRHCPGNLVCEDGSCVGSDIDTPASTPTADDTMSTQDDGSSEQTPNQSTSSMNDTSSNDDMSSMDDTSSMGDTSGDMGGGGSMNVGPGSDGAGGADSSAKDAGTEAGAADASTEETAPLR
jgi:hypothetical protein